MIQSVKREDTRRRVGDKGGSGAGWEIERECGEGHSPCGPVVTLGDGAWLTPTHSPALSTLSGCCWDTEYLTNLHQSAVGLYGERERKRERERFALVVLSNSRLSLGKLYSEQQRELKWPHSSLSLAGCFTPAPLADTLMCFKPAAPWIQGYIHDTWELAQHCFNPPSSCGSQWTLRGRWYSQQPCLLQKRY